MKYEINQTDDLAPRRINLAGPLLVIMILLFVAGFFVHYQIEPIVHLDGRSETLAPWEVAGGLIVGLAGLIVGLFVAFIGIVVALGATGLGLLIAVGTVVGPFLLAWLIFKAISNNKRDRVSENLEI